MGSKQQRMVKKDATYVVGSVKKVNHKEAQNCLSHYLARIGTHIILVEE
jgi:hypothetical protein